MPLKILFISTVIGQTFNEEYLVKFIYNDPNEEKKIGTYSIGEAIAEGSFGVVKEAMNTRSNLKVAVKIIRKDASEFVTDKIPNWREIEILQKLNHPNIVKMLDTFQTSEKMYIFMEHIEGRSLKDIILTTEQPLATRKYYFKKIASAILYCHEMGIFHRDIKPR